MSFLKPRVALLSVFSVAALLLSGCSVAETQQRLALSIQNPVALLVQMQMSPLDPAASKSLDDAVILSQLYPTALRYDSSQTGLIRSLGEQARFLSETEFEITVAKGMRFANGNSLTASDVAFSLNRFKRLVTAGIHSNLLRSFVSATAVDDQKVLITLDTLLDISFPHALTSIAGMVVDEQVFSEAKLEPNDQIVAGQPFAGDYVVTSYDAEGASLALSGNPEPHSQNARIRNNGVLINFAQSPETANTLLEENSYDAVLALGSSGSLFAGSQSTSYPTAVVSGPKRVEGLRFFCEKSQDADVTATSAVATEDQIAALTVSIRLRLESYLREIGSPEGLRVWGSLISSQLPGDRNPDLESVLQEQRLFKGLSAVPADLPEIFKRAGLEEEVLMSLVGTSLAGGDWNLTGDVLRQFDPATPVLVVPEASPVTIAATPFSISPQFQDASAVIGSVLALTDTPDDPQWARNWVLGFSIQAGELREETRQRLIASAQRRLQLASCFTPLLEYQPQLFLAVGLEFGEASPVSTAIHSLYRIERAPNGTGN